MTNYIIGFVLIGLMFILVSGTKDSDDINHPQTTPVLFKGEFEDDYGIHYRISDTLWIQYPSTKYHIISWNEKEQYILARNDDGNPGDRGLFTRIDYMQFTNMEPFIWGFCLTNFNAITLEDAKSTASADRKNPKKGCGGFPFSRMKKLKK